MKKFLLISLLIISFILVSFYANMWVKERIALNQSKQTPTPTAPVVQYSDLPDKVAIGLSLKSVQRICGQPDDVSTFETANNVFVTLTYKGKDETLTAGCFGRMTFTNSNLTSISR